MRRTITRLLVTFAAVLAFAPAFADCVLRQSDAIELQLGPFVDSTDGVTAETGLTIAQADVRLSKCAAAGDCGAWAQANEATSAAHGENGWYEKDFNTTDTDTVGILMIAVNESGALPVFKECLVVETAVYDALYADAVTAVNVNVSTITDGAVAAADFATGAITATVIAADAIGASEIATDAIGAAELAADVASTELANLAVNVAQVSGDSTAADNFEAFLDLIINQGNGAFPPYGISASGTAQSYTAGTPELVLASSTAAADNDFNGHTLLAWGDAGEVHSACVEDYTGASDAALLDAAFPTTPAGTIRYVVYATASCETGTSLTQADVRTAVGLASANLDTQLAAIDDYVDTEVAAILDDTGTAGVVLANDAITAAKIAADAIGSSELATDAIGASELATDAIGAAEIASAAIAADEIATDAIGAAELAAGAIAASEIATDAIDADAIATDAIGAAEIAASAIAASEIATDAIGAAELAADVASTELLNLAVNVAQISGDSGAADTLETAFDGTTGPVSPLGIARQGTAQSATGTTLVLDASAPFADDTAIGMTLVACGSTQGYCQSRSIDDYVNSTDTATVETWTVTPSGTITYYVFATAPGGADGGLDAAGVRAAVGLASANLDTQLSTIDDYVDTEVAAILDDTGTSGVQIPAGEIVAATFGAGAIDATAIAADAIGASELATDAIGAAEIAADAITASELATDAIGAAELAAAAINDSELNVTGSEFTAVPWNASWDAEVQSEADDALVAIHLDHLFQTTYDPASKPGAADALLNELVESDAGVARYTANSLEQAPTGGGESLEAIADAVWDELLSGHTTMGSSGEALADAQTGGGLDAAGVRAAVGLASANLDTQLSAIDDFVDTEVAAILDDTGTSGVQIPAGEIVAATFGAGAIDATAIAADAIGASELATDAIGAAEIAADALGASEIATDAIGAAELAANAIAAAEVADGAIDALTFAAGAIDATAIATDAIGAAEIASAAIAADEIATDAIGAAELASDSITSSELAATAAAEINAALVGTCSSGSTTTCVDAALTQAATSQLDDRLICFDDSWCALITDFTTGTDTVTTTKVAPSTRSGKAYTIFPATLQ